MEKVGVSLASVLFLASLSFGAPKERAFTGEIMDSQCAAMGSHRQMMKQEGAKDAKDCTLKCVDMGGKFVLYNRAKKAIYQLDDQDQPRRFAGENAKITGTYDKATKTIHVDHIDAAS